MLILNPIASLIYLIHLAVNITMLFIVVRIIQQHKKFTWLTPLDKVGKPLTESLSTSLANLARDKLHKRLSDKGKFMVSAIVLTLTDALLIYLLSKCS